LDSLARQNNLKLGAIKVLIIDNNCTDGTMNVVKKFRERLPIRRVTENRQGLAYARNRAVAEFRGDFLLFTDDDVRLGPGWLARSSGCNLSISERRIFWRTHSAVLEKS
jgi:glycosyltransferase involved in cell wall biosynthesis